MRRGTRWGAILLALGALAASGSAEARRRRAAPDVGGTRTVRVEEGSSAVFFLSVGTAPQVVRVISRASLGVEVRVRHAGPRNTFVEVSKPPDFRQEIGSIETAFIRTPAAETKYSVALRLVRAANKRARARVEVKIQARR